MCIANHFYIVQEKCSFLIWMRTLYLLSAKNLSPQVQFIPKILIIHIIWCSHEQIGGVHFGFGSGYFPFKISMAALSLPF